jgi:hypothetical protein
MNTLSPKLKKLEVDKDKFDAALQKILAAKPLPLKDVVGTSIRGNPKNRKRVRKSDETS